IPQSAHRKKCRNSAAWLKGYSSGYSWRASFLGDLLGSPPQESADGSRNDGNRQYGKSCRKPDKADGFAHSGCADTRAHKGVFGRAPFFFAFVVHSFPFWFFVWKHGGARILK